MRLLILGKNGQVGWELQRSLAPLGEVVALGKNEVDLANRTQLRNIVRSLHPEIIVNAAAYNEVDRAEGEAAKAMAVNADAPGLLAEEAKSSGSVLIHYSTDYIFDGKKGSPYLEDDMPSPISEYGRSKLAGERRIQDADPLYLILRTSWVYSMRRDSFVAKVLKWSRENQRLRVVDDQVSSPSWCRMLAEITASIIKNSWVSSWPKNNTGIFNLAGTGYVSRFEWAQLILRYDPNKIQQICRDVEPAVSSEFDNAAKRPRFSALNCGKVCSTFNVLIPSWQESLQLAIENA